MQDPGLRFARFTTSSIWLMTIPDRSSVFAVASPTPSKIRRAFAALSVLLVSVGLFVGGAQPIAVGLFTSHWDKLAHVLTFMLIGLGCGVASGLRGSALVWACVAGAGVLGGLDELHQASLPGRSVSWADLVADIAGGLLAGALLLGWQKASDRRFRALK